MLLRQADAVHFTSRANMNPLMVRHSLLKYGCSIKRVNNLQELIEERFQIINNKIKSRLSMFFLPRRIVFQQDYINVASMWKLRILEKRKNTIKVCHLTYSLSKNVFSS